MNNKKQAESTKQLAPRKRLKVPELTEAELLAIQSTDAEMRVRLSENVRQGMTCRSPTVLINPSWPQILRERF